MNIFTKALIALSATFVASFGVFVPNASADKVAIEPMFTYGESLTQSQFNETKQLLGVQNGTKEIQVNINELNGLLQDTYPYNQVYSSTYITPANNQGGVTVEIVTPQTITEITNAQYQNAAITAGAVDVNIKVASAVKVDGSGALAGVYKAFAASGNALNNQAVKVAQEELGVTSTITAENEGKTGYSDELLNAAIADIKSQIAQTKEGNNNQITADQITTIVNNTINNYNLTNVLSADSITQIQNLMIQFSQIELTQEQKDNLTKLGSDLQATGGQLLEQAKSSWDKVDKEQLAEDSGNLWDAIVRFFSNIFSSIFGK